MKISRIRIKNLNSLRLEYTIDFEQPPLAGTGLFAITGDTGAGKTTILDALTLALYGQVHRNKQAKDVLSYGSTESFAEVEFYCQKELYRARWSIWRAHGKPDGNLLGPQRELAHWDPEKEEFSIIAEKVKEVDTAVETVSGLDYNRFCRSVMLSQGDFAAFLKASEKERSDLLERITGTEIYSTISRAAYAKNKEEEAQLAAIENKLEGIQLLDKQEVEALGQQWTTLQEAADTHRRELQEQRRLLQWLEAVGTMENQLANFKKELDESIRQTTERQDEFAKLEAHHRATPLLPKLTRVQEGTRQKTALEQEIGRIGKAIEQAAGKEKTLEIQVQETLQRRKQFLEHQNDRQALFEKVRELDIALREKKAPLLKAETTLEKIDEQIRSQNTTCQKLQKEIKTTKDDLQSSQDWLEQHQYAQNLGAELEAIRLHIRQYKSIREETAKLEKEKGAATQAFAGAQKELAAAKEERKALLKQLQEQRAQLAAILPESKKQPDASFLQTLQTEIEQLTEKRGHLAEIQLLSGQYKEMLTELNQFQDQLDHLQHEELATNKEMLTILEQLEAAEKQLEFKMQVYEQQRLIANYEKDRNRLKEGDPCPLCFSTSHPFREKEWQPFVDESETEFHRSREQHKQIQDQYRQLVSRQQEVVQQIEQLTGNEVKAISGQMRKHLEKILAYEERIAGMSSTTLAKLVEGADGNGILQHLQQINGLISEKKTLREKINRQAEKVRELEDAQQQLLHHLNQKEMKMNALHQDVHHLNDQCAKNAARLEVIREQLSLQLSTYRKAFKEDQLPQIASALEQLQQKYEDQKTSREALRQQARLLEKDLGQAQKEEERLILEKNDRQKDLEATREEWTALSAERTRLFGEENVEAARAELAEQSESLDRELTGSQEQLSQTRLELKELKVRDQEKQQQLDSLQVELRKAEEDLGHSAAEAGFSGSAGIEEALMETGAVETLEDLRQKLTKRKEQLEFQIEKTTEELKGLRQKALTEVPRRELEQKVEELEQSIRQKDQETGVLQEKLEQQKVLRRQRKALVTEINAQKKECQRWARLNDLIGQADGKKFRVFAQSLTLDRLVFLANQYLENLDGRYIIKPAADEPLALEIIDTFQADNVRSMNTLSGGESFLVSLALALGLSDLAGRNARIDSLFIDEGFGTLDEATLDLAITTLENLQSKGKTIGVISHVKALKERIGTQISVVKKGSGFSTIEVVG